MGWLLALALSGQAPFVPNGPPDPTPWRLVATPMLHVGIRPHAYVGYDGVGVGVTLQITLDSPYLGATGGVQN